MKELSSGLIDKIGKMGFLFFSVTLFLMSFPRSWSLYPLGLFLFSGLMLWILDFERIKISLLDNWYLIMPPVLFFIIHLFSVVLQKSDILILEDRLMFILIPIFGFPIFRLDYTRSRLSFLFKPFLLGILCILIYILVRIIFKGMTGATDELSLFEYLKMNSDNFLHSNFSVLEHPSYLSMKVIFAIVLLICLSEDFKISWLSRNGLFLLLSIVIIMLASRAGIIAWVVIDIILLIKYSKSRSFRSFIIIIVIPFFLILTYLTIRHIERIDYFISTTKRELSMEEIDWKNIDQRTREWYAAIQLIKEHPISGVGLAKIEDNMVEVYLNHGFKEEAELRLNAHNQYLETQMTFGIVGTLSLLWMLLTPLIFRKQFKYPIIPLALVLIMSFYLIFESMFNRQWGIMFFLLFYLIFIPVVDNRLNFEKVSQNYN